MKTNKYYTWEIVPTNTPVLKKKCSKCNSNSLFYCSEKFRLNSQKKLIDVWLIYRCEKCDSTYNLTILSRTKPEQIDRELYKRFSENDKDTSWRYAFDLEVLRRNQIEPDYAYVEYEIMYEKIPFWEMLEMNGDSVKFEIKCDLSFNLKLTTVIRKCFDLSLNQLARLLDAGVITVFPLCEVKKCKVKNEITVIVHLEKLRLYPQSNSINVV